MIGSGMVEAGCLPRSVAMVGGVVGGVLEFGFFLRSALVGYYVG